MNALGDDFGDLEFAELKSLQHDIDERMSRFTLDDNKFEGRFHGKSSGKSAL